MGTIIIYGAGGIGRTLLPKIKRDIANNLDIVFADGNPTLWGCEILGCRVINPADIPSTDYERIIITTAQGFETVNEKLTTELNISSEKIDDSYIRAMHERTFETRNRFVKRFAEIVSARSMGGGHCAEGGVFEGYFAKRINAAFPDKKLYLSRIFMW